jgi:hypothetical protein
MKTLLVWVTLALVGCGSAKTDGTGCVVACGNIEVPAQPPVVVAPSPETTKAAEKAIVAETVEPVAVKAAQKAIVTETVEPVAAVVDYMDWAALDGDPEAMVEVAEVIAAGVDSLEYSTPFCAARVIHTDKTIWTGHSQRIIDDWCWDTVTGSVCTDKGVEVDLPADYWEHNGTLGWAQCPAGSKGWYKENVLINEALAP